MYFNYGDGSSGYGEATLGGVGVYRKDGSGDYSLVREDLIAGGYHKDGAAYFPVTDAQGNIRGYANTSGVQSAYVYYPYGTLIDLAHDDAEDSRRWQAKEFDSDINKYYFGARFYDPLFGLWLTPDPAGQFANPYTYGGDPLNYIDPNGESLTAAVIIGAAIGAAIGGTVSAVNCSGANEVGCGKAIAQGVAMGALKGAASAAVSYGAGIAVSGIAEAAGAAQTGYAALEMGSSAMSAAAQGAAVQTGIVSGASAWASSVVSSAFDRGNEWYRFDKSFGEDLKNGVIGGLVGVAFGGISGAYQYNSNTAYQWKTHENVLNYGYGKVMKDGIMNPEILEKMGAYVQSVEGVSFNVVYQSGEVGTAALENNVARIDANTGMETVLEYDRVGVLKETKRFRASRFYSSVVHENGHLLDKAGPLKDLYELNNDLGYRINSSEKMRSFNNAKMELGAISRELNHKYSSYWSFYTQKYAMDRYLRNMSITIS